MKDDVTKTLELAKVALYHTVPDDCYSTGPLTGTPRDYHCIACNALKAIDAQLSRRPAEDGLAREPVAWKYTNEKTGTWVILDFYPEMVEGETYNGWTVPAIYKVEPICGSLHIEPAALHELREMWLNFPGLSVGSLSTRCIREMSPEQADFYAKACEVAQAELLKSARGTK